MQAGDDYSSFSLSFCFCFASVTFARFRSFLMRNDDIRSQSGRSIEIATVCGMMGKRRWDVKILQQLRNLWVIIVAHLVWPGVHGTGSHWCSWSDPQYSGLHGRTPRHFSQSSWLSCSLSCWWTPLRGPHTGETLTVVWIELPFISWNIHSHVCNV